MIGFVAFVKKEWLEHLRTYKIWIMLAIFLIFGIMSPFFAKIMPELLMSLSDSGELPIAMELPASTALDSYSQFFKNITQMGMVVLLLVYSGMLSQEISKGTLIPVLTKGLSRTAVILSKYTVAVFIWTISISICFTITYLYTIFLFPPFAIYHLFLSVFCVWLFGAFLLALSLCTACLVKGTYGGLLLTGMCVSILMLMNMFPALQPYNPIRLNSDNLAMLNQGYDVASLYPALIVTVIVSVALLISASLLFKKKTL